MGLLGAVTGCDSHGLPVRPANMYQDDPTETETFVRAMDSLVKARGDAEVMGKAFDWNNATELLDVGSGPATYPIALCKSFPALRATIFDLTGTLKFTQSYVREAGLEDQIRLIPGHYRKDTIPGSYDIVFLSNIIHAEGESDNESLVCKLALFLTPADGSSSKIISSTKATPIPPRAPSSVY
jgi:hypothetical protein